MLAKLGHIISRFIFGISDLPQRFKRFFLHFLWWFPFKPDLAQYEIIQSPLEWLLAIPFYILDILLLPEIYELIFELVKWNMRYLDPEEQAMIQSVFKESVDPSRIRLDERAVLGPKQKKFAYVSFQTINSYGKMRDAILIHETVHVWQFLTFGSVYILKALKAQHSKQGYNYGSIPGLVKMQKEKKGLLAFNFEQQGDIIMDYYRLLQRSPEQMNDQVLLLYRHFVQDLYGNSNYEERA